MMIIILFDCSIFVASSMVMLIVLIIIIVSIRIILAGIINNQPNESLLFLSVRFD